MSMYKNFAAYYDLLQRGTDYFGWADYIERLFKRHGIKKPLLILDLACGTGNITIELANRGYDMIGIDRSVDMLNMARQKSDLLNILYLNQDIADFELYGTVDAVTCCLDSINYLNKSSLEKCFRLVRQYLNTGGCFIFDINTEYKFKKILDKQTFTYDFDELYCVWQNRYNPKKRFCDYYLTFFIRDNGGKYTRCHEKHREYAYSVSEIKSMLKQAGFKNIKVYSRTKREDPERLFFFAGV